MTRLLFVFLCLAHLVQGTSTNSTSSSCLPPDGTTPRSVLSILGSCALTLLVCVWHTLHPDVLDPRGGWFIAFLEQVFLITLSFFAPEVVVGNAAREWCEAHRKIKKFREKGYEWSMTHSYFAQMGGFVYRDDKGESTTIDADKFLELCKAGEIADPLITVKEIKDKSKSDALGKAIFALQLFWFTLQVAVHGSRGLAVTLVELDTVCMSVLAVVYLLFWWDKPLRAECPHVFCYTGDKKVYSRSELSKAWKSEPGYLQMLITWSVNISKAQSIAEEETASLVGTDADHSKHSKLIAVIEGLGPNVVGDLSFGITWLILGGLHLLAWNFEFPTETEKIMWRVASLVLTATPPVLFVPWILRFSIPAVDDNLESVVDYCAFPVGMISRALLVGLMLASLRALPCSAYLTVSWTAYIPHL